MDNKRIDAALRAAGDTRRVVIGADALSAVDSTFAQCFEQQAAVVVADEHTWAVAGRAVSELLRAAGRTAQ
ncbi:MAG: sn-glycerol-1-phosphate dehydrogenase, partial [Chloroflexales bacterium]|nr:sn-glycerol-1-phosphate dehydrogenase [Chloroflexales bacterium]